MTDKNIRNLVLQTRLYNLFRTERSEYTAEPPKLINSVQPVVDMHKFNQTLLYQTQSSSAASADHFYTVPVGKAWIPYFSKSYRANVGDISVQIIAPDTTTIIAGLNLVAASAGTTYPFNPLIRLTEGYIVAVGFAAGVSGSITSLLTYLEEDA